MPAENWDAVDILNPQHVFSLIQKARAAECYYLPAFHHSAEDASLRTGDPQLFERSHAVHVRGLIHFLHAIAQISSRTRLFYATSYAMLPTFAPTSQTGPQSACLCL